MRFRQSLRVSAAVAATILATHGAGAQAARDSIGPRQGSWGAEASYGGMGGGASLLWFVSPRTAWVLGATFTLGQETSDQPTTTGTTRTTSTTGLVGVRAGYRWWRGESSERMRPFVGLGLSGSVLHNGSFQSNEGSAFGELGATYFFSPHVSLGTAGELALVGSRDRFAGAGPGSTIDRWFVRGNLVRVIAAVYF